MRRYDEAEKYIDRALSLAPGTSSAHFSKAQIAIFRDGDLEKVNSYIQEVFDHAPRERDAFHFSKNAYQGPGYVHRLAEIYTIVGEYEAAIDKLDILLASDHKSSI